MTHSKPNVVEVPETKKQRIEAKSLKTTTFSISPSIAVPKTAVAATQPSPSASTLPHGNSLALAKECIYCIAKRICLESTLRLTTKKSIGSRFTDL